MPARTPSCSPAPLHPTRHTCRMWGRLLGLTFVVPAAYFAAKGAINGALARRLGLLFTMGGTQVRASC